MINKIIYMNKTYFTPEIEIIEVHVEGCLAASLEDPVENPEIDW